MHVEVDVGTRFYNKYIFYCNKKIKELCLKNFLDQFYKYDYSL